MAELRPSANSGGSLPRSIALASTLDRDGPRGLPWSKIAVPPSARYARLPPHNRTAPFDVPIEAPASGRAKVPVRHRPVNDGADALSTGGDDRFGSCDPHMRSTPHECGRSAAQDPCETPPSPHIGGRVVPAEPRSRAVISDRGSGEFVPPEGVDKAEAGGLYTASTARRRLLGVRARLRSSSLIPVNTPPIAVGCLEFRRLPGAPGSGTETVSELFDR